MSFVIRNTKWVMLVAGLLTATTFYGVFAPQSALESMFGASFNGSLESIIIRSWSALVGLIGTILIVGAFSETHRAFAISIAAVSKFIFVALILVYGQSFLGKVAPAIVMDCVVIAVAVVFLLAPRPRGQAERLVQQRQNDNKLQ